MKGQKRENSLELCERFKSRKEKIVQNSELCERSKNYVVAPELSADCFPPLLTVSDPRLVVTFVTVTITMIRIMTMIMTFVDDDEEDVG